MRRRQVAMLWLDLDGTVREGKDDALGKFVNGPGDVRVFPEAVERMRAWKDGGGRIVGITNQGGIALGYVKQDDVTAAVMETQRQCDGLFDHIMVCPHHPDAPHPLDSQCWCRKPRIGLIAEAAIDLGDELHEMYPPYLGLFVGDRPEDRACAEAANLAFLDAKEWRAGSVRTPGAVVGLASPAPPPPRF